MVSPVWKQAIKQFSNSINERLPTIVKEVRLFGSVAMGTETVESDIDILVLVESDERIITDIIMEVTVDINLNYDVVISPIILTESHYTDPLFRKTAFFHALEQGISI